MFGDGGRCKIEKLRNLTDAQFPGSHCQQRPHAIFVGQSSGHQ